MKINLILILLCVLCFSGCQKETEVAGEVFIVTKGADNIKLGGINISIISEDLAKSYIESAKPELERQIKDLKKFIGLCGDHIKNARIYGDYAVKEGTEKAKQCYENADYEGIKILENYFDQLPAAISTTTTDSGGKFNIKLPKRGKYVVAVRSSRQVINNTENYFWLLPVDVDGETRQIILTNKNMVGTNTPESLIQINK